MVITLAIGVFLGSGSDREGRSADMPGLTDQRPAREFGSPAAQLFSAFRERPASFASPDASRACAPSLIGTGPHLKRYRQRGGLGWPSFLWQGAPSMATRKHIGTAGWG